MRSLKALLPHPEIAQIGDRVISGGAGADDDHAASVAYENRGGDGVLAGMFENYARAAPLADDIPNRLAERARFRRPLIVFLGVFPMRHHAPMKKFLAIDDAFGAQVHAEIDLLIVAHD